MFKIAILESGRVREFVHYYDGSRGEMVDPEGTPDALWKEAPTAAKWAQGWNEREKRRGSNTRFRVVPYVTKAEREAGAGWRDRERQRFLDGTYAPVLFSGTSWFKQSGYADLHFPHISQKKDEPGMIAYTPDEARGIADRQVPVKIGRYLNKFFRDYLTPTEIADICAKMGVDDDTHQLKFATKAAEMRQVYLKGPHSCMSYEKGHWGDLPIHPVDCYALDDTAVAYLEEMDDESGEKYITARAICRQEKKEYGRVYGDAIRFEAAMARAGYAFNPYCMAGAKLRRVIHHKAYIVPYVDNMNMARRDGDFLVIDNAGDVPIRHNKGYTAIPTCCMCRDPETHGTLTKLRDKSLICPKCLEKRTEVCDQCHEKTTEIHLRSGKRKMCRTCGHNGHAFNCWYCGETRFRDEIAGQDREKHSICAHCVAGGHFIIQPGCKRVFHRNDVKCNCNQCRHHYAEERKAATAKVADVPAPAPINELVQTLEQLHQQLAGSGVVGTTNYPTTNFSVWYDGLGNQVLYPNYYPPVVAPDDENH